MARCIVHGLADATRRMLSLPQHMVRRMPLRDALRSGAEVISDDARALAPEDTGLLKASIAIRRGRPTRLIERVYIYVRARAYYWFFVERGTSNMAAQPFMVPAFDRNAVQCLRVFQRNYVRGVDEAVASLR